MARFSRRMDNCSSTVAIDNGMVNMRGAGGASDHERFLVLYHDADEKGLALLFHDFGSRA